MSRTARSMGPMTPSEVVSGIFNVFEERGHRAYGEDVTELQHALQCATLARLDSEEDIVVAACLLHDYGHLLHDLGEDIADQGIDTEHERVRRYDDQGKLGEMLTPPLSIFRPLLESLVRR